MTMHTPDSSAVSCWTDTATPREWKRDPAGNLIAPFHKDYDAARYCKADIQAQGLTMTQTDEEKEREMASGVLAEIQKRRPYSVKHEVVALECIAAALTAARAEGRRHAIEEIMAVAKKSADELVFGDTGGEWHVVEAIEAKAKEAGNG